MMYSGHQETGTCLINRPHKTTPESKRETSKIWFSAAFAIQTMKNPLQLMFKMSVENIQPAPAEVL